MDFYAQNMSFPLLLQFVILNPKNTCITSCNLGRVRAMFTAIKMLFNYKSFHHKCSDFAVLFVVKSSPIHIVHCNSLCARCLHLKFTERSNNSYDTSPTLMADYALEKRISFTIDSEIVHLECDTWCRRVKKRIVLAAAAVCCPDEFKIWLVLQGKKIRFHLLSKQIALKSSSLHAALLSLRILPCSD